MNPPGTTAKLMLPTLLATLLTSMAVADEVEHPAGGWRLSTPDTADYMQDVHYPAVRVNAGGKDVSALVSGRIHATAKPPAGAGVPLLVINGAVLPMPLEGEDYARPYTFGSGSNSVEVRDQAGNVAKRTQFFESNPNKVPPKLRVILSWDSDHTDVDLHVIAPNGEHTWYGNRVTPSGAALDIDVTDGYGPEIFSSLAPVQGTYLVYANYYGGNSGRAITAAQVTVIQHENTPQEKHETFNVPLRAPGDLNFVTRFIYQR